MQQQENIKIGLSTFVKGITELKSALTTYLYCWGLQSFQNFLTIVRLRFCGPSLHSTAVHGLMACRRDGDANAAERTDASVSDAADDVISFTSAPAAAAAQSFRQ